MAEDLIKNGEAVQEERYSEVNEPTVQFKLVSDRTIYHVKSERNNEVMVEISGYDLNIAFNMEYINCIEDIEAAVDGIGQLFREIITEKLLEHKQSPQ